MRRTTLYSRSPRDRRAGPARTRAAGADEGDAAGAGPHSASRDPSTDAAPRPRTLRHRLDALARRGWPSVLGAAALAALLAVGLQSLLRPVATPPTQDDIDAAVRYSLENRPPEPSTASKAYDVIRPSVVLVRRLRGDADAAPAKAEAGAADGAKPQPEAQGEAKDGGKDDGKADAKGEAGKPTLTGVGTGVVFSEDGLIFTNLHVITGQDDIGVVFADGTESEVEVVDAQPENDLAVLKAKTLPDDLKPATLRSTRGLRTGDEVLAVGFPFGIGPTATWGVVSGLRREHYSEQGRRNLVDLIQFDAAANPGNSGGPLVTRDGDVVGIVTAIVNPTDEGFFVGIGFAVPIENAAAAAGISPF